MDMWQMMQSFYFNDTTLKGCIDKLNNLIVSLSRWLNSNLLVPNTDKTVLMLFSPFRVRDLPDIMFMNRKLEWVSEVKYLGMHIDEKLSYNIHINKLCNRISIGQGILYSLSNYLPVNVLLSIYYGLVYPHLNLNVIIWGGCAVTKLVKIRVAVNKVLRNIFSVKRDSLGRYTVGNNELYKSLNVLKFDDIYITNIVMFIHSILYGTNQNLFNEYIGCFLSQHNYSTRSARLNTPYIRLEVEKQSTLYNLIKIYNNLPSEFLQPQSKHSLKKKCKELALMNY